MSDRNERITVRLPQRFLSALDFLVEVDDFSSRSEAIRTAIRDFVYDRVALVKEKLEKIREAEEAMASIRALQTEYLKK